MNSRFLVNNYFCVFVFQPCNYKQSRRDKGNSTERHLDKRFLGHSNRLHKLSWVLPAFVRGFVSVEPLGRRLGPQRLPPSKLVTALRGHISCTHTVPNTVARTLGSFGGRSPVRRAPRPRRSRSGRGGQSRFASIAFLFDVVPVLRGARPTPRSDARPPTSVLRCWMPS